jgi:hypothetical protein
MGKENEKEEERGGEGQGKKREGRKRWKRGEGWGGDPGRPDLGC